MKLCVAVTLCISLLGCGKKNNTTTYPIKVSGSSKANDDYNAQFKLENYLASEPTDTSKVQVVNFKCAVVIYPTHEQVEQLKKTGGEENFYAVADDANFNQTRAIQLFDSLGIKTAGTQKQFIKFVGGESSWTLDVRKKNLPVWNVILFTKEKAPQPTPATSVTYESIRVFFE